MRRRTSSLRSQITTPSSSSSKRKNQSSESEDTSDEEYVLNKSKPSRKKKSIPLEFKTLIDETSSGDEEVFPLSIGEEEEYPYSEDEEEIQQGSSSLIQQALPEEEEYSTSSEEESEQEEEIQQASSEEEEEEEECLSTSSEEEIQQIHSSKLIDISSQESSNSHSSNSGKSSLRPANRSSSSGNSSSLTGISDQQSSLISDLMTYQVHSPQLAASNQQQQQFIEYVDSDSDSDDIVMFEPRNNAVLSSSTMFNDASNVFPEQSCSGLLIDLNRCDSPSCFIDLNDSETDPNLPQSSLIETCSIRSLSSSINGELNEAKVKEFLHLVGTNADPEFYLSICPLFDCNGDGRFATLFSEVKSSIANNVVDTKSTFEYEHMKEFVRIGIPFQLLVNANNRKVLLKAFISFLQTRFNFDILMDDNNERKVYILFHAISSMNILKMFNSDSFIDKKENVGFFLTDPNQEIEYHFNFVSGNGRPLTDRQACYLKDVWVEHKSGKGYDQFKEFERIINSGITAQKKTFQALMKRFQKNRPEVTTIINLNENNVKWLLDNVGPFASIDYYYAVCPRLIYSHQFWDLLEEKLQSTNNVSLLSKNLNDLEDLLVKFLSLPCSTHITVNKDDSSMSGFTSFLRMNGISLSVEPSLKIWRDIMVKAFKKLNVCSLCRDPLPIGRENHATCDFCSTSMVILFYSRTKNAYLFSVSKWKTCLTSLRDKCRQGFDGDLSILMVIHHTHRLEWWCKIVGLIPDLDNFLLLPNLPPHCNYPYDTVEMVFSNEELEYYMDIIDKVIRYIERHDICSSPLPNGSHGIEVIFEPNDGLGNQTLTPKKKNVSNSEKLTALILSGKLICEFTGRVLTVEDKVSADHVEHLVNGERVARFRSFCSSKINQLIGRVEVIYRQKRNNRDETLYYFEKVLNCVRGSKDDVYEDMPCYFNLRDTLLKDGEYYSKERIIELLGEEKIRKEAIKEVKKKNKK